MEFVLLDIIFRGSFLTLSKKINAFWPLTTSAKMLHASMFDKALKALLILILPSAHYVSSFLHRCHRRYSRPSAYLLANKYSPFFFSKDKKTPGSVYLPVNKYCLGKYLLPFSYSVSIIGHNSHSLTPKPSLRQIKSKVSPN